MKKANDLDNDGRKSMPKRRCRNPWRVAARIGRIGEGASVPVWLVHKTADKVARADGIEAIREVAHIEITAEGKLP